MRIKLLFILFFILSSQNVFAGHYYKTNYYPSAQDAKKIAQKSADNILDVCCSYPDKNEIEFIKQAKFSELKIRASYFPSEADLQILEGLNIKYTLILDEVFPSEKEITRINLSHISLLHILSKDFPTMGEVNAFNQFTKPVRFDILKMRLPLVEEMDVIRSFKADMIVGFYNNKVPGPGDSNFFNSLNTEKVFVVLEQFPWGIDAEGFALLTRSNLEIDPSELLMPQDVFTLNQFNALPKLTLRELGPIDSEWAINVKSIKASQILIQDRGDGELLNGVYSAALEGAKSPIVFQLSKYY